MAMGERRRASMRVARRLWKVVMATLALVLVASIAGLNPASAERKGEITVHSEFPSVNACTGEPHVVSIDFTMYTQGGERATVLTVKADISTTDGFSGGGPDTQVTVDALNAEHIQLNYLITNPDTGQAYRVHFVQTVDLATDESTLRSFDVSCVRS